MKKTILFTSIFFICANVAMATIPEDFGAYYGSLDDLHTPNKYEEFLTMSKLPGSPDLNNDGCIDEKDINITRAHLGCSGYCMGDADGNGQVEFADITEILISWNECLQPKPKKPKAEGSGQCYGVYEWQTVNGAPAVMCVEDAKEIKPFCWMCGLNANIRP